MALIRNDSCKHYMDGTDFHKCLMVYTGTHNTYMQVWEVEVLASDLPGNTDPTDAEIQAVADPRATDLYNTWTAALGDITESSHSGQAGTVIA